VFWGKCHQLDEISNHEQPSSPHSMQTNLDFLVPWAPINTYPPLAHLKFGTPIPTWRPLQLFLAHSLLGCSGCGWGATGLVLGLWGQAGWALGAPPQEVVWCQQQPELTNSPSSWRSPSSGEAISPLVLGARGSGALAPTTHHASLLWLPPAHPATRAFALPKLGATRDAGPTAGATTGSTLQTDGGWGWCSQQAI